MTFEERLVAQEAIEEVYWHHRIWPKENPGPKPPLSAVMSDEAIRTKVEDYLRKSNALEKWWRRSITSQQLRDEMDRMAASTRAPEVLREIRTALGNDPVRIAETLARPALVDRMIRDEQARAFAPGPTEEEGPSVRLDALWTTRASGSQTDMAAPGGVHAPAVVGGADCSTQSWQATSTISGAAPSARYRHTAVWTGAEMIVWGGEDRRFELNTGGRYDPATDSWTATSTGANVPSGRSVHTAVWTGTEMIVWGGLSSALPGIGGRYNPATDTWLPTATGSGTPSSRFGHTAVWTGTEMIVWGGSDTSISNTGGRYNPSTDLWTPTSIGASVPSARFYHTAVWTGAEMLVWGGLNYSTDGGRYNPSTDTWTAISTGENAPFRSERPTAVWTGTEMIAWGGCSSSECPTNTGGRYNPSTDTWLPTSTGTGAPAGRLGHEAVWTGTEMIVWGGCVTGQCFVNTGARYNPSTEAWTPTSIDANVPSGRYSHTAVWTGSEMIVWGGSDADQSVTNTGGRYTSRSDGVACDDGDACTKIDTCQAGVCTGSNPVICAAGDQCHVAGACDPTTGVCSNSPLPNGTACDDGNACAANDTCIDGQCVGGAPLSCDDSHACTTDSCDPHVGCSHAPGNAGVLCRLSAGPCDVAETCTGAAVDCPPDAFVPSTTACRPAAGDCSSAADCTGTGPLCPPNPPKPAATPCANDGNVCTADVCDGGGACAHPFMDADGDGVCDASDQCPNSITGRTLIIESCDPGVSNAFVGTTGCTMADEVAQCSFQNPSNHGAFVSCVAHLTDFWRTAGFITGNQKSRIQRCAAHTNPRPVRSQRPRCCDSGPRP